MTETAPDAEQVRPAGSGVRPVLVVEHEPDGGLDLLGPGLGPLPHVVRPYLGDPVPELGDHAGLVVLGGSMGAGDDEIAPWLPATRELLAAAVRAQVPTLGICLGAQLLAAACGGAVEPGAAGLELGFRTVTPLPATGDDPLFSGITASLGHGAGWTVAQYHRDAVTRLPADAVPLVTGTPYPHQAFRVGPLAWGVQYHPEVSTGAFIEWVLGGVLRGALPSWAMLTLAAARAAGDTQARTASAHARSFTALLS